MTCDKAVLDLEVQETNEPNILQSHQPLLRVQNNRMMLDLRQQVQWQRQVIRDLKEERDRLTRELDSRLFFVEAQLQREQKHIEALLSEKDQYIQFQALQIHSLKYILSNIDSGYNHSQRCARRDRATPCGRKIKPAPLSKRYSVALDEYMKENGGIVSRAQPVMIQADSDGENKERCYHAPCSRTRSLPELRFCNEPEYQNLVFNKYCYDSTCNSEDNVIDELAARRWTSDCDSEHSDSLDSGISSPSIQSRNIHSNDEPFPFATDSLNVKANPITPRRSSTIGNFIHRTFSASSTQLEKIKYNSLPPEGTVSSGRQHNSSPDTKTSEILKKAESSSKVNEDQKSANRFMSSANRNFGTNHRNVTKPRDIKFRKLFKFRRRTEPQNPEPLNINDYMTV